MFRLQSDFINGLLGDGESGELSAQGPGYRSDLTKPPSTCSDVPVM